MKFLKNMHNGVDTIKRDSPILPDGRFETTTEPLRGSMIAYSGHYPHTECLRHIGVPRLKGRT
ncbi:MAG: hypothetical protein ACI30M_02085 [Muribaculaceae bacterium]